MHVFHPIRNRQRAAGGGQASVDCRQKFTDHIARVHVVFAEGIRQGILHPEPAPAELAGLIEGTLRFFHHAWSRENPALTLRQGLNRLETCLLPLLWAHPENRPHPQTGAHVHA